MATEANESTLDLLLLWNIWDVNHSLKMQELKLPCELFGNMQEHC